MADNPIVSLTYALSEEDCARRLGWGCGACFVYVAKNCRSPQDRHASVYRATNQFLSSLGAPTRVEAQIGIIYARDGIAEAEAFIEAEIWPRVERRILGRASKIIDEKRRIRVWEQLIGHLPCMSSTPSEFGRHCWWRVLSVLRAVDTILCEDTRVTGKLLRFRHFRPPELPR